MREFMRPSRASIRELRRCSMAPMRASRRQRKPSSATPVPMMARMIWLVSLMQGVYHVRGLEAEADDGPQGWQMDQRPGRSGRVASWSLKSQGAAVCQASRKSNTANPTASFLGRKGRNSLCKRFGGTEVRWRLRNRSLPRIAQGIRGCLSLPDLRGAGYGMISAASAGKDMAKHSTSENPGL